MRRALLLMFIPTILVAAGAVVATISDSPIGAWLALAGIFLFAGIAFAKTFGLSIFASDVDDDLDL